MLRDTVCFIFVTILKSTIDRPSAVGQEENCELDTDETSVQSNLCGGSATPMEILGS